MHKILSEYKKFAESEFWRAGGRGVPGWVGQGPPNRSALHAVPASANTGAGRGSGSEVLGELSLAAEINVKRWLPARKHRDLAEQFQAKARALVGDSPRSRS
ncbi:hypothetical protein GCM10010521_38110 [Streptomyces rameus]|uniref:Uncharacterized protein n=1 Tax=Streptomyces rameus TaxID=68261 RepID=A0ABP6NIF7_9ACTN